MLSMPTGGPWASLRQRNVVPSAATSGVRAALTAGRKPQSAICRASNNSGDNDGFWPFRSKAVPPPPPPPPPQPPRRQQQQQQQQPDALLRTSPKWRWPAVGEQPQARQNQSKTSSGSSRRRQQQQLSPEQQQALQDMLLDSTVNPKWRWPMFPSGANNSSSSGTAQRRQQQRPSGLPLSPPPPPPPSAQQLGRSSWWRLGAPHPEQQQQWAEYEQQRQQYEAALREYEQQQKQWQWPFVGGAFQGGRRTAAAPPEEEFREQLEAMGVDLSSSRERQQQQQQRQQQLQDFDQLDDKEIARYMDSVRQSRLARVQGRQDDEVVGIAGLYLALTLLVLFMAALANQPG